VFDEGGTIVALPESFVTSPLTPGGLCKVSTLIVLLVKAEAGVRMGPDVTVSVPPNAEIDPAQNAVAAKTTRHALRRRVTICTKNLIMKFGAFPQAHKVVRRKLAASRSMAPGQIVYSSGSHG
jgi:hypothetical protein